ncbi:LOW QUALITY PROTEIN: influenza virus NS1A-binding protein homolog [Manduca sexta]|uniref:LOW QUALITY PROTEIN: influenza virus NS1A-binding protein homolog n=1 Tax=Manduca sexta TaxID=7130 RepID=UPI00188FA26B|nr:LOW QUALITY PROTEIN: influenza virus NS1A-binding protein homolog [Manduca sexta]
MKPRDDYRNGDGHDEDSEGEDGSALEEELSLCDREAPARALCALNALRKSRQHYDAVLVAGGVEVPAHRAVLAAASPYLLEALTPAPPAPAPPAPPAPPAYRVEDVDPEALRELVEFAYTGRARVRDAAAARRLYRAAWRLRVELVRAPLAERLLRRLAPHDCLEVRALPDLAPEHIAQLDAYIAQNFEAVCSSGALAALPVVRIELLREGGAGAGSGVGAAPGGAEDAPHTVADAALAWLRDHAPQHDLEELCSRVHLLYVNERGVLRDCGELPAARGDAPELQEYRREAAERARRPPPAPAHLPRPPRPLPGLELGARAPRPACAVLAARAAGAGATGALLAVRGRLAAARVCWRDVGAGAAGGARGALHNSDGEPDKGERRALLATGRCAHGVAALDGRLVVCGGYDRARVLRAAEQYDPASNTWSALPDMRGPRARFPAAVLGGAVYVLGGSDGHAELDTVDALQDGAWTTRTRLPLALSHAAAVADEAAGALYVVGGWTGGVHLKRVLRYTPSDKQWSEAPPLSTGRSQCAAVLWGGALWALGGCDAWHCLSSTETLRLDGGGGGGGAWSAGPALPTARRSVGGAVWRGRLVSAGGSDGAASLRRTEWLEAGGDTWRGGPALRRARAGLGLAVFHDVLYAVGGFDGKEFLACVECLYEPEGEWTALCAPPSPVSPPAAAPPPTNKQDTKENGEVHSE